LHEFLGLKKNVHMLPQVQMETDASSSEYGDHIGRCYCLLPNFAEYIAESGFVNESVTNSLSIPK
jgi:hypothetical protein